MVGDSPGVGSDSVVEGGAGCGAVCVQAPMRTVPARSKERNSRDSFIVEHVSANGV